MSPIYLEHFPPVSEEGSRAKTSHLSTSTQSPASTSSILVLRLLFIQNSDRSSASNASRERCCVHFQSSILAYVDKSSRVRPERLCLCKEASGAGQLRPKLPKPAPLIDEAEEDVLACLTFPQPNRTTLHRTTSAQCPGSEIKRRMDDVGLFTQ